MKIPFFARWCLLVGLLAALAPASWAQFPKPAPVFSGTATPVPPLQDKPWKAPKSAIPTGGAEAIAELFADGLADPRECEYREVELPARELHSGSVIQTRAWVLPGQQDGQRFAVAWDGLVHPAISVGKKADLAADVAAKIAGDEAINAESRAQLEARENQRREDARRQGKPFEPHVWEPRRFDSANAARRRMDATVLYPINIALLLRAGEPALTEKVWKQWYGSSSQAKQTVYAAMANDWLWALYDRAVNAHTQADDGLSLASARALEPAARAVRERIATSQQKTNLDYLDSLPELLADQERRAKETARQRALETLPPLQGRELVDALVRDLEFVSARQWGQPGGVDLMEDQIVRKLAEQGEAAVEPLLLCLEADRRLTRSVRYGRDFHRGRTILGAREAAYVALANILKMDFFTSGSTGGSLTAQGDEKAAALARAIREYWEKNRAIPLEERWYRLLADDASTPAYWKEAASSIVAPADVAQNRSSMFGGGWQTIPNRAPGEIPALRGEALRAKTAPSVSELFIRRMQTEPSTTEKDGVYAHLDNKLHYALALAKWDGRAHLDLLRTFTEELKADLGAEHKSYDGGVANIVKMYEARIAAGDAAALAEYAAWLPTLDRTKDIGFSTRTIFRIMWQHPDDPVIKETAKKLFLNEGAPWNPQIGKARSSFVHGLVKTPLIGMPEFREAVIRSLQDKSTAGSVTIGKNGNLSIRGDGGWGLNVTDEEDSLKPAEGETRPFRVCDIYARQLSEIAGFPKCAIYWPSAIKDAAIVEIIAFLRREGDFFKYQPGDDGEAVSMFEQVRIHLPKLTQPATREDVEQGRAIFALEGERRVWDLPTFPAEASWTTLKTRAQRGLSVDRSGKTAEFRSYDTRGRIYQAEEVLVDGKWERYFGFVGPHTFAKAPAAEIEFHSKDSVQPFTRGYGANVTFPDNKSEFPYEMAVKVALGSPLKIVVQLQNRSGLDQPVPGAFRLPAGENKGRLPQGVKFSLIYLAKAPSNIYEAAPADWQEIPPRPEVTNTPAEPDGAVLVPTQRQTLLEADLRDYFDLGKPGTYRLRAAFEAPGGPEGVVVSEFFQVGQGP